MLGDALTDDGPVQHLCCVEVPAFQVEHGMGKLKVVLS